MLDLVENPKDQFSCIITQVSLNEKKEGETLVKANIIVEEKIQDKSLSFRFYAPQE